MKEGKEKRGNDRKEGISTRKGKKRMPVGTDRHGEIDTCPVPLSQLDLSVRASRQPAESP